MRRGPSGKRAEGPGPTFTQASGGSGTLLTARSEFRLLRVEDSKNQDSPWTLSDQRTVACPERLEPLTSWGRSSRIEGLKGPGSKSKLPVWSSSRALCPALEDRKGKEELFEGQVQGERFWKESREPA